MRARFFSCYKQLDPLTDVLSWLYTKVAQKNVFKTLLIYKIAPLQIISLRVKITPDFWKNWKKYIYCVYFILNIDF